MKTEVTWVLVHFVVYCLHFTTGNQYLQYCIQISTLSSPASSFYRPALSQNENIGKSQRWNYKLES